MRAVSLDFYFILVVLEGLEEGQMCKQGWQELFYHPLQKMTAQMRRDLGSLAVGLGVTEAWERQGRAELGGLPPSGQYAGHSRAQASSWLAAQCLILDNESM